MLRGERADHLDLQYKTAHLYYSCSVVTVDWSHRANYVVTRHHVTPEQADEALADPAAVVFDPDYNSHSGEGVRTIGYSPSCGDLLTVITVEAGGVVYGANAWEANDRDRRYYQQAGEHDARDAETETGPDRPGS